MDSQAIHVMTITNSIIGVSLLAMPYCFKQCGIVLSVFMLIISNAIARLCCHLMLKSAVIARRRTFEFLAFHTFGSLGKFTIEIGLIGFLLGTCIAYFVVMGDLGPAIIAKMSDTRPTDTMRTSILLALALFCVLPLGLLRNIDSLHSVCTVTVLFYFCLVLKIISEAVPHIISGDWISKVEVWRPSGILQCLPIFSMALSCQTQIFEIYQALPTVSLEKMNHLIGAAVNICTGVYICVGVFGYIAFATQTFSGNILMSFSISFITDLMKIGFVLSLAFSFPLIIFPCRASLNSLLCRHYSYTLHDGTDKYIPESRFKGLTFLIVLISLMVGLMIPSIELVLGLLGSTIGIMVCVLFPATCFICVSTKNTNERILAQIMLFIGVLTMVLGTYANLYVLDEIAATQPPPIQVDVPKIIKEIQKLPVPKIEDKPLPLEIDIPKNEIKEVVRHEPPQPIEPVVDKINDVYKEVEKIKKESLEIINSKADVIEEVRDKPALQAETLDANPKKAEEVDIEAIKREEKEILEEEKQKLKEVEQKNMDLIKKMEKQNEMNKKVAEESKKLLEEIKQRQIAEVEIKKVEHEKIKAVEEIQEIAKKAIERLSLVDSKDQQDAKKDNVLVSKPKNHIDSGKVFKHDNVLGNNSKKNIPEAELSKHNYIEQEAKPKLSIDVNQPKLLPIPLVKSNLTFESRIKKLADEVVVPGIKTTLKPVINLLDPIPKVKTKENVIDIIGKLNLTNFAGAHLEKNKTAEKAKEEEKVQHREIRSVRLNAAEQNGQKNVDKEKVKTNENKIVSTESPRIKLVTKMAGSLLDNIKLPDVDNKDIDMSLQPLKRDLKNFEMKKR
ncbi:hypothetical protein RN001_009555 [Aquatica leii]|uniref:Amino acid transporter transmembrane domain-containing protein n=1 Tax=Aquatica leii TaxID=1421715 RepID=A0AAN7SFP3_9COLE|nr:hypothetical protein RN001_009555 [Aquatica leii]